MINLVSAIAAVAAVMTTFLVYRWQRERKQLEYETLSHWPLLDDETRQAADFELRYKGKTVLNPYLLLVRFVNSGNKPISSDDYETLVRVELLEEREILLAEVVESSSDDLDVKATIRSHNAVIKPVLLNPGDWFTLKLLLSEPADAQIRGRIEGVRQIRPYKPRPLTLVGRVAWNSFVLALILGLEGLIMGLFFFYTERNFAESTQPIIRIGLVVIFLISAGWYFSYIGWRRN